MTDASTLCDVTGTVPLGDAAAVADAVDAILARAYGDASFDRALLHATFAYADRLYSGGDSGYLACDMPYHDLRHALDAALVTARLVDGCRADACDDTLAPELGLAAVVLALLHDTGFLRHRGDEASLCGPRLAATHEARGAAIAAGYLRETSLATWAGLASLILATRMAAPPGAVFEGCASYAVTIGRMLGSADLLCQMADRRYLERCFHHLYPELVLGGGDRVRTADGQVRFLYRDARDLVSRTPAFFEGVVRPRLDRGFANIVRHLAAHFGGADPYADAIRDNLERCTSIVSASRWDLLEVPPPTTTRELDPIYGVVALRAGPPH